ncbi:MAG TPA: hypothetical protein PK449_06640, partial [Exilispira sp.]|nr:hypothetical protein [Exilispira sp.]
VRSILKKTWHFRSVRSFISILYFNALYPLQESKVERNYFFALRFVCIAYTEKTCTEPESML